jgi:hypothetical protein
MSRTKTPHRTGNVVSRTWQRTRQAAVRLKPAPDHVIPLARNAGAAAKRQADRTRSWAAPQLGRAGQAVQDSIAPTVSSALSAAAKRLAPARPRRPRRRKLLIGASAVTAAAGVAAAAIRSHLKTGEAAAPDEPEAEGTEPAETSLAMETGNGQRSTSSEGRKNNEARTS